MCHLGVARGESLSFDEEEGDEDDWDDDWDDDEDYDYDEDDEDGDDDLDDDDDEWKVKRKGWLEDVAPRGRTVH